MNKKTLCLFFCFSIAALLPLFGCSKSQSPEYRKFNSFAEYKNFDQNVVAIEVQWDVGGGWDEFTVTDGEQVNEIVKAFNDVVMKRGEGHSAGDNSYVTFVYQDGTKVTASLFTESEGNDYYYYTNSNVRSTVRRIGRMNNGLKTELKDLSGYRGFNLNVSEVNVSWYNDNGGFDKFTINDLYTISQIENLYFKTTFSVSEKRDVPKSEIEFVYNTNETFKLGLYQVWDDGHYFNYSNNLVSDYIEQLVNQM